MALSRGDLAGVSAWLVSLGRTVEVQDESTVSVIGIDGARYGLSAAAADPFSNASHLAFALLGSWWPRVVPNLLRTVDRLYKEHLEASS
jgi:hypothetical protein